MERRNIYFLILAYKFGIKTSFEFQEQILHFYCCWRYVVCELAKGIGVVNPKWTIASLSEYIHYVAVMM